MAAVAAFLVAASPLAGPEGLTPGTVDQFALKIAMGAGTRRCSPRWCWTARTPRTGSWATPRW